MELTLAGKGMLALIFFSLFVAWRVKCRRKTKIGCLGFGYISLVVFCISLFAIFITSILTIKAVEGATTYMNGEKCIATIASYHQYQEKDDEGYMKTMHRPTYEIKTSTGDTYEVVSNFSTQAKPVVGEQLSVLFDKQTNKIVELSAMTVIMVFGMFIMWIVVFTAFVGLVMYSFNCDMSKYIRFVQAVGMAFFIPLVMISFEALLIYGLFYGNDAPFWVSAVLVFFIIILGLAILGMIKLLINRGLPKWKQTGVGAWSADWDNEEEEKVERRRIMMRRRIKRKTDRKKD